MRNINIQQTNFLKSIYIMTSGRILCSLKLPYVNSILALHGRLKVIFCISCVLFSKQ